MIIDQAKARLIMEILSLEIAQAQIRDANAAARGGELIEENLLLFHPNQILVK